MPLKKKPEKPKKPLKNKQNNPGEKIPRIYFHELLQMILSNLCYEGKENYFLKRYS